MIRVLIAAALALPLVTAQAALGQGDAVQVEVEQFGTGNIFRPGDMTAVRLKLTASIAEPMSVWVQWEVPNVDGDIAEYGRIVALTPGQPRLVWLYAPVSPQARQGTTWTVRMFEDNDGARGAEIGGSRIAAGNGADPGEAMIGVVGSTAHLGLRGYAATGIQSRRAPNLHEYTHIVTSINPTDTPDRWEGWLPFEAVAWADADPSLLTTDQAEAIREYVRRGGHLVIVLPQVGNPWGLGVPGRTEFGDLLPTQAPRKDEGTPLSEVLPVISKAEGARADFDLVIQVFGDLAGRFDALDRGYQPIMALPDGRVVVVQRTFGHGHITISGIDVASRRLYSVPLSNGSSGLPQTDVFWGRILGRRADTPTPTELTAIQQANRLARGAGRENTLGRGQLIMQQISMSQEATIGLLASLLLFAGYWLIAGPGAFYALKMYRAVRYSWVAFAGAAALFTAIAWGTVGLIRQNEVAVKHVTVLDHIYRPDDAADAIDPQYQRAVSWFSVRLPGYADAAITIEPTETETGYMRDLLHSWTPPGDPVQQFPDTDRYRVDVGQNPAMWDEYVSPGNRDSYERPSRSTSTVLHANWQGGLDPDWGGLFRIDPSDPIRVEYDATGRAETIAGTLISELPVAIEDTTFIWVKNNRTTPRRYQPSGGQEQPWVPPNQSGAMFNNGEMVRRGQAWAPGQTFDLKASFDQRGRTRSQMRLDANIRRTYIEPYAGDGMFGQAPGTGALSSRDITNYMEMLSIYHQLDPPAYLLNAPGGNADESVVLVRELGRELDLSVWLNRPCLIVMGYLRDSELPIPLRVNGAKPVSEAGSVTMVRWIYPLPVREDIAFDVEAPTGDDEDRSPDAADGSPGDRQPLG